MVRSETIRKRQSIAAVLSHLTVSYGFRFLGRDVWFTWFCLMCFFFGGGGLTKVPFGIFFIFSRVLEGKSKVSLFVWMYCVCVMLMFLCVDGLFCFCDVCFFCDILGREKGQTHLIFLQVCQQS